MMEINDIDIKILKENFDEDLIKQINVDNITKIFKYLIDNNVWYAKDLFLSSLDLFLLPYEDFIKQFEKLKSKLGKDYVERLGEDISLIQIMYE